MKKHSLAVILLVAAVSLGILLLPEQRIGIRQPNAKLSRVEAPTHEFDLRVFLPGISSVPLADSHDDESIETGEGCPPRKFEILPEGESEDEYKARTLALVDRLAESNDGDHLLAAALLSQLGESDSRLELLAKASDIAPRNRLVAWNRLLSCRHRGLLYCNGSEIETNAIEIDGSNGAVWMEIAMLRLADNRSSAAIEAVRHAIAAPRIDTYFIDHAMLLQRALAIGSDLSYRERIFQSIGYSAAMPVSYYNITKHCEVVDENVGVWIELCDQLGAKMYLDGRTLMDQAIGRALQKIAAGRSGDQEWIEKSMADYEEFKARRHKLLANRKPLSLLYNDEMVLVRYVENFATYGEMEAQTRLQAEARRLQQDPNYDRCNFESPWAAN